MNTAPRSDTRELDHRSGDGPEVSVFWRSLINQVFVAVRDERQSTSIEIEVDPAHALDAFLHPFAYAQADGYALAA